MMLFLIDWVKRIYNALHDAPVKYKVIASIALGVFLELAFLKFHDSKVFLSAVYIFAALAFLFLLVANIAKKTFSAFAFPDRPVLFNISQSANNGTGNITLYWDSTAHAFNYRVYFVNLLNDSFSLPCTTRSEFYIGNFPKEVVEEFEVFYQDEFKVLYPANSCVYEGFVRNEGDVYNSNNGCFLCQCEGGENICEQEPGCLQ